MRTFSEILESKKFERLELKVGILMGKSKGNVTEMDVFELADSLDIDISGKQVRSIIKKSKQNYGY